MNPKNRITAYYNVLPGGIAALLSFLFFFTLQPCSAQDRTTAETHLSITVKDRPFQEVLAVIEYKTSFKFAYSTESVRQQKNVTLSAADITLSDLLASLFRGTGLTYTVMGHQIVLRPVGPPTPITLSGYIKDSRTGELLIGASVVVSDAGIGTVSNPYGFYSITVPSSDSIKLETSYIGYQTQSTTITGQHDLTLSFNLQHSVEQEQISLLTVTKDKREDNVKKNQLARIDMSTDMISGSPSLAGSGDVISSIEMMPGVQAGIDGTPGYFVRGGNAGQNLILLDDATLYNPSHIFGLVGIFNTPAIKRASLLKGSFPASYGDHVSSVLDIAMKDGSSQQPGAMVEMGTIAAGATLYGPIETGNSSYFISARRSTSDWLLKPILDSSFFNNYYFYDVNAKLNFALSPKDRLFLSFYSGRDNNNYTSDSTHVPGISYNMHFGNTAFTARWNHQYSGKLFGNTTAEYDRYHQFVSATQQGYFAQLYSGIRDVDIKTNLTWYLSPAHRISGGLDYLYQTLYPASLSGKIPPTDSSTGIIPGDIPPKTASRVAAYVSDEMRISPNLQLSIGLRTPYYFKPGVSYFNVEPRVSLLYLLDPTTSIKLSYMDVHQYIHLIQSYNSSFPAEIWIGSGSDIRPQVSHEISAGVYKNFKENTFQTSVEVYYKRLGNQLLFGGVSTPTIDNAIDSQVIVGKAWDYGAELFLRKNRGKWTGWLSYTFAYAWQHFDSLNLGNNFPFAYDRRQMLDLSVAYQISPHWKIAANFTFATGRAFTLDMDTSSTNPLFDPRGNAYGVGRGRGRGVGRGLNRDSTSYGIKANNYRLPAYDRLDLSIRYKKTRTVRNRVLETEWIFSVYNVYARSNNSFVYRTIDPSTRQVVAREVPFIPVIPSLTYSLKF